MCHDGDVQQLLCKSCKVVAHLSYTSARCIGRPACACLLAARTLRSARNCYALIADCCVPVETARVEYAIAFRMLNEVFCGQVRRLITL